MKSYTAIQFKPTEEDQLEQLTAALLGLGFDGLDEQDDVVVAYIDSEIYTKENIENELNIIFNKNNISYSKSIIKEENWNQVWESNFDPVRIGDFVGIRASFHPHFEPKVKFEMEITPKMSFGTGHHATTHLVIEMMEHIPFQGASVYDFGTGTGVLAILAEKLGAQSVLAVDNDVWCIENAQENIVNNHCKVIDIQKVETAAQASHFDIILANVNRHIIEANMDSLTKASNSTSTLIFSGLLVEDQLDIEKLALQFGWKTINVNSLRGWISMHLKKQ
jgi:ribosomal protein L11 methyltransferase